MSAINPPTGTITFLFTDIQGSTALWQRFPQAMPLALERHHQLLRQAIEAHQGYVFQIVGDGFCAAFPTALDGVGAALAAQRLLGCERWGETGPLLVRMTLHTGAAELRPGETTSGEYASGLTLSRAARLLSAGHGGQVLVSQAAHDLLVYDLPADVSLLDLGERRLRDLSLPERIYQLVAPDLPSDFPPLKTLDLFPNNLPAQVSSFIGRAQELERLEKTIATTRLATITGAGGCGKTRLALQLASRLVERYRDGVWLVELAAIPAQTHRERGDGAAASVYRRLGEVFGLKEDAGLPLEKIVQTHLHEKKCLLLFDNCEHLIDSCAQVCRTILSTCPQVDVLATSRAPLEIEGEKLFPLAALSAPSPADLAGRVTPSRLEEFESVQLFLERLRASSPDFTLSPDQLTRAARICQRLDGIPLALELAAARGRSLGLEQILRRLDDRFRLLTGGVRADLPHHQTLQALLDWSFDLLTPQEQLLFARLAIFPASWRLEAAEAVCSDEQLSSVEALDALSGLVDKSLVIAERQGDETRYRYLETIRQYAELKTSEPAALQQRYGEFHLEQARRLNQTTFFAFDLKALQLMDAEQANFRKALSWAIETGCEDGEGALELANGLAFCYFNHGFFNEAKALLNEALACGQKPGTPRAMTLAWCGGVAFCQGDYPPAQGFLDESLSILQELGSPDPRAMAQVRHLLGHIHFDQQDYPNALALFEECLDQFRQLGDRLNISTLIKDLGLVAYHLRDYTAARRYFQESLDLSIELGTEDGIAYSLNHLGDLSRLDGDFEQAESQFQRSLEITRRLDLNAETASNLHKLGMLARERGELEAARGLIDESLSMQLELGNKQGIGECLAGLGGLAAVRQEYGTAAKLFAAVREYMGSFGAPLAPVDELTLEADEAAAREALGADDYDRLVQAGRALEVSQAIALARKRT